MHELSVAQGIVTTIKTQLAKQGVTRPVEQVRIRAGRLNAIVPESLTFHFDVIKREHPQFAKAELVIETDPLTARCPRCNDGVHTLEEPVLLCPKCDGAMTVVSGQDLWVESVIVTDEDDGTIA